MHFFTYVLYFIGGLVGIKSAITEKEYALVPELFKLDDYDRCLMLKKEALYCSVTIQLGPAKNYTSKVWRTIESSFSHSKILQKQPMHFFTYVLYFIGGLIGIKSAITEKEYALVPELFKLDDYDRCLMLKKEALYCSVTIQLGPAKNYTSKVWRTIEELISNKKNFRHDRLRHGVCVPLSCPHIAKNVSSYINNTTFLSEGISECYTKKYGNLGLTAIVTKLECESEEHLYQVDTCDIIVGILCAILFTIVVFASFYEGLARYNSTEEYKKITMSRYGKVITCFSLPKNWDRLRAESTNSDATKLRVINGIRVYTMFLVIMTHTCVAAIMTAHNPKFVETMTSDPLNMLFVNGNMSIQVFLLISGFLLSYHFFLSMEKKTTLKIGYFVFAFINRYIRLTTCLVVMIALHATWIRHLSRGPLWYQKVGVEYENCRENWWTNLLYINNYYNVEQMCLQQTWYIAADTQLFTFSLILLMIVWKYKNHIMKIFIGCFIVGLIIPAVINYVNSYDFAPRSYPEALLSILVNAPEWTEIAITSHTNISISSLGLIMGYIFYKYREKKIVLKKRYIWLWWILVWSLPLSTIYLGIPLYADDFVYSRLGAALYVAFSKSAYVAGIGLAILGISQNIGWFLRDAVTWQPLQVLGRITYSVYLVHTAVVRVKLGQERTLTYITIYTLISQALEDFAMSYIFALILCLFVELPTSALQKLMMPQLQKDRNIELSDTKPTEIVVKDNSEVTKV
ncbi:hypothetical protein FQA39_LY10726 [Lamprigera yunnana]|nr:hypothetical protein FQA39_LY10726 [Lamprigera yunnana]